MLPDSQTFYACRPDGPMLLTISTAHRPATDLGYLLHKHPERFQSYDLSFGKAHVFYPEASAERCRVCLVLDVDPVGIVRGKGQGEGLLDQYVNDRPYVASSFLSVAISQVFGSALQGRCSRRGSMSSGFGAASDSSRLFSSRWVIPSKQ
jgi:hypothetical protein